jgi:hypothetical protein
MKKMEDSPEREAIIHRMIAIVIEECPWIFGIHTPSYALRHSWHKNGKNHSISGNYVKYVRLDPEVRRAYRDIEDRPNYRILLYPAILLAVIIIPAVTMMYRRRRKP